jgi:hypothetical protein
MLNGPSPLDWRRVAALVPFVACLALALALKVQADSTTPIIVLGPVTVANGVATVSGHVADQALAASLTVNGQPVSVDSSGQFSASFDLGGQNSLSLSMQDPATGQTVTTTIPLSLAGATGVIPNTVLDQLRAAGVSVTIPTGGLTSLDGQPVTVSGSVRDPSRLASLTVNGKDVLGELGPGGSFAYELPVGTREVTIQSTDRQGVSQKQTFGVRAQSSTIQTSAGTSVSAAGALGLRIVSVRYLLRGVKVKKRFTMIVTVKDRRGYLVRDAIVRVLGKSARSLRPGTAIKLSNKVGRASFLVRPRLNRFGKRLFVIARAKTPTAKASKATSVRLPKLRSRKAVVMK